MATEDLLSPGLIKGKLLSELGGTALIFDALYHGNPVVIKQAINERTIPFIQREHEFLTHPPFDSVDASFRDFGMPTNWKTYIKFVGEVSDAVSPVMLQKGVIVLEKVSGKTIFNDEENKVNLDVPLKFHFAAIMGWINTLRQLRQKGIVIDSNIDTDLFLNPDFQTKTLNLTKIDCMPSPGKPEDNSGVQSPISIFWARANNGSQNLTFEQAAVDQIIQIISQKYIGKPQFSFLGTRFDNLAKRFNEGMINDSESLLGYLERAMSFADWNNDFVSNGDDIHLRQWVGGTFIE